MHTQEDKYLDDNYKLKKKATRVPECKEIIFRVRKDLC